MRGLSKLIHLRVSTFSFCECTSCSWNWNFISVAFVSNLMVRTPIAWFAAKTFSAVSSMTPVSLHMPFSKDVAALIRRVGIRSWVSFAVPKCPRASNIRVSSSSPFSRNSRIGTRVLKKVWSSGRQMVSHFCLTNNSAGGGSKCRLLLVW